MRGEINRASSPRGGVIDTGVSAAERERAFRRARRHSLFVKSLKVLLPVTAVACLGVYGGALVLSSGLKSGDISASKVTVDPTNLTMADPRYSGFGKDGSEYKVHAKSAVTDLRMAGPIRLDVIDGEIVQPSGVVTRLNAKWGTYDQKKDLLELYENIHVDATNGMTARLTRATVLAKESRIISSEPVQAQTETGTIRADTMTLDTKARRASFRTAVHVTLQPSKPATASKGAETVPKREPAQAFGIDANSGEPVIVTSEQLDVDDNAKTALFRDTVVARQGEATLEAPELDVTYAGRADLGSSGATSSETGGDATSLKSIKARGGVRMASKADRAESQSLDYDAETERIHLIGDVTMTQQPERTVKAEAALLDQKADAALLTGDVEVTQGRNVLKGGRLAIDRKGGTAKLTTPASAGRAAGRISTLIYQNQAAKPGAPAKSSVTDDELSLGPLGANFRSDPNAPIEVEAQVLDVNDRKHTAVYTGSVVAKQGTFVVRTEEMTAHYSGETGLAATSQPTAKEKAKAGGASGSELRRIEARRGVVVTGSDSQQATGEWATFDVKANTIVMGGNVTVTQGKQVVRAPAGMRLLIDLGTGVTRFEADPGVAAKTGPKVSGAFATSVAPGPQNSGVAGCPPGAVCKSGRLEAIFYPNQIQENAGQKIGAGSGSEAAKPAREPAKLPSAAARRPTPPSTTP